MEAIDTVMSKSKRIVLLGRGAEVTSARAAKVLCEAQAEISFKAGDEQGVICTLNTLELEAYLTADKLKELLNCQKSQSQNSDAE